MDPIRTVTALALTALALLPARAASAQCWSAAQELRASAAAAKDGLGQNAAISGDTAVFGVNGGVAFQAGSAYVFERDPTDPSSWVEVAHIMAPDAEYGDLFGQSVAISGDTIVVGAPYHNSPLSSAGAAYVFERDKGGPGAWGFTLQLLAPDPAALDEFGRAVAIAGDTLVVGAPSKPGGGYGYSGAAYVFQRNPLEPGDWSFAAKLRASDPYQYDQLGLELAIAGDTIAIGVARHAHVAFNSGAVYVYQRNHGSPGAWGQSAELIASDSGQVDAFGYSVALSGDTLAAGAIGWDSPALVADVGAVYVFERDGPGWFESRRVTPAGGQVADHCGQSLALEHDRLVAGGVNHLIDTGAAWVFERDLGGPGLWGQAWELAAPPGFQGEYFGFQHSLALQGHTILAGDLGDGLLAPGAGVVHVFEAAPTSVVPYCTSGRSSSGCQALSSACGSASASAPAGFDLTAHFVEGARDGLFFYGANGRQAAPWGNGTSFQCVAAPVRRGGLMTGAGTSGTCDGAFTLDLNARWCPTCPKPAHNPGAGATVQAQLWYRDPLNTSNKTTALSNAIEFQVAP